MPHGGVDGWAGGAAGNLLFAVRERAPADWEPMGMSLEIRRVSSGRAGEGEKALALLLLVLRDLADGWLALGFGGTRGRGTVSVSEVRFTGNGLPSPWASLAGRTPADVIDHPPEPVTQGL